MANTPTQHCVHPMRHTSHSPLRRATSASAASTICTSCLSLCGSRGNTIRKHSPCIAPQRVRDGSAIKNSVREINGAKDYGSSGECESDCKHPLEQSHANADQNVHRTPPRWPIADDIRIQSRYLQLHIFTSTANVRRFSILRRSGAKPGTSDPGEPVLPPDGVTPPAPEKYG